jgi:hypothetical protein
MPLDDSEEPMILQGLFIDFKFDSMIICVVGLVNLCIGTFLIIFVRRLDRRVVYVENYLREEILVRCENRAVVV